MIKEFKNTYIALGSFDGIHEGHMSLVKKTVELAKKNNGTSIVFTFKNHPREILNSKNKIKLLMNNEDKEKILLENNIDYVYFQEFTEKFMKFSPRDFIKYIKDKFNVKGIVVGFNFRFGYKNLGDVNLLEELSKEFNYELYVLPPCVYDENPISSTLIRKCLLEGNVEKANIMLGRSYYLEGKVAEGRKIGRTIGFPTANLEYNEKSLLPKEGVYYTLVLVNNNKYKSITNIGNNPTVNGKRLTIESYILDFEGNIYGENIKVNFIKRIRDVVKFNSLEELKHQLEKDKNYAKEEKIIYN